MPKWFRKAMVNQAIQNAAPPHAGGSVAKHLLHGQTGWPRPRQVLHFQDLLSCPWKLGDELGRIVAVAFYVAEVTLSAPQARLVVVVLVVGHIQVHG